MRIYFRNNIQTKCKNDILWNKARYKCLKTFSENEQKEIYSCENSIVSCDFAKLFWIKDKFSGNKFGVLENLILEMGSLKFLRMTNFFLSALQNSNGFLKFLFFKHAYYAAPRLSIGLSNLNSTFEVSILDFIGIKLIFCGQKYLGLIVQRSWHKKVRSPAKNLCTWQWRSKNPKFW